jgi:arylsulfatase A-like enzyme
VFGQQVLPDLDAANQAMWAGELPRGEVERIYDAEVHSLDTDLGIVLAALAHQGRIHDPLLIVVADHGEEFWDHGMLGHGHTLHDELIRVPLIVQAPGQDRGLVVDDPVSLLDVAPTVLEAVGAELPATFEGRSLWSLVRSGSAPSGNDDAGSALMSELIRPMALRRGPLHERALMLGSAKLIVDTDGTRHYFDRAADPQERGSASLPEAQRRALDAAFERLVAGSEAPAEAETVPLDDETRAELEALGYLEP